MGLKACKECKKEISDDVGACPNCGKKNPHGKTSALTWIIAVLVIVGAFKAMAGSSTDETHTASPAASRPAAPPIVVDNKKLWQDYHANEVAADAVYKGKRLLVSGTVASITKGMLDEIVVHLVSPNEFENTMATIDKAQTSAAGALSKGQRISVLCEGGGMVIGDPSLRDCRIQ